MKQDLNSTLLVSGGLPKNGLKLVGRGRAISSTSVLESLQITGKVFLQIQQTNSAN